MLTIGKLADASGCTVGLIRHYEKEGLLPPVARSEGNQRRYMQIHLQRLLFIRHGRELGFTLTEIRELIVLSSEPQASCQAVDELTRAHLEQVKNRIKRLHAMRDELERMLGQCQIGRVADCRIIETLSDHELCDHSQAQADHLQGYRTLSMASSSE
ncbi:helix-turn-helix domain-containing protein [Alcanivorax sp.]|jgi:DNA-binding transcriptional MerR regulator|uniref:MerR family transcriptional regulator n=1 Tax=Alcanivorax sp. TaxID=1872427 RepID=UPI000C0F3ECE|nr:helix-turn-helix domain-containing protein [Alcanivorax sp.]PHR67658.1 MAG: MerR family transcriptional regulator [Alcanivorax sp.]|tara:strand:+ start:277 stop:747 length:471 start_codon:yes stop_codon:yes gene_type:complete